MRKTPPTRTTSRHVRCSPSPKLFHLTGSKRRTRLDTMIAATAILSGAELATTNPADFEPFVPHGLNLHSF